MANVAFPDAPRLASRNRQDLSVLVLSDSTADGTSDWVYRFAALLATEYPTHTVAWNLWNGTAWNAETELSTGTGLRRITFWNGSDGGYSTTSIVTLAEDIIEHPDAVDYIVISLGHNSPRGVDDYQAVVDAAVSAWPSAVITFCYQNPRTDNPTLGTTARANIDTVVATNGCGLLDAYQPFIDYGDYASDLLADAVHPNAAGSALWATTALDAWEASMSITAQTRTIGNHVLLSWTDTNPDSYTIVATEYDYSNPDNPITRTITLTDPDELVYFDEDIDTDTDKVSYVITNDNDANTGTAEAELTNGYTFGQVDTNETSIRYTTLAAVKKALGVPSAQTDRDDEITDAVLAAESWIDDYCGRSFPDTSANPQFSAIPNRVTRAALLLSTSFYTAEMSPDVLDPFEADLRSERASNMAVQLLSGFRATFGVA